MAFLSLLTTSRHLLSNATASACSFVEWTQRLEFTQVHPSPARCRSTPAGGFDINKRPPCSWALLVWTVASNSKHKEEDPDRYRPVCHWPWHSLLIIASVLHLRNSQSHHPALLERWLAFQLCQHFWWTDDDSQVNPPRLVFPAASSAAVRLYAACSRAHATLPSRRDLEYHSWLNWLICLVTLFVLRFVFLLRCHI